MDPSGSSQLFYIQFRITAVKQKSIYMRYDLQGFINGRFIHNMNHLYDPDCRKRLPDLVISPLFQFIYKLDGIGMGALMMLNDTSCFCFAGEEETGNGWWNDPYDF